MAWMLEFLLVVRALAGLGAIAGGDRPDSMATHVGYLLASVCVIPIALGRWPRTAGRGRSACSPSRCVAVGVISVRMMVTL